MKWYYSIAIYSAICCATYAFTWFIGFSAWSQGFWTCFTGLTFLNWEKRRAGQ